MAYVKHRISLGTVGIRPGGKNDITVGRPVQVDRILTADSTLFTADMTTIRADGALDIKITADSTAFTADSTLGSADANR